MHLCIRFIWFLSLVNPLWNLLTALLYHSLWMYYTAHCYLTPSSSSASPPSALSLAYHLCVLFEYLPSGTSTLLSDMLTGGILPERDAAGINGNSGADSLTDDPRGLNLSVLTLLIDRIHHAQAILATFLAVYLFTVVVVYCMVTDTFTWQRYPLFIGICAVKILSVLGVYDSFLYLIPLFFSGLAFPLLSRRFPVLHVFPGCPHGDNGEFYGKKRPFEVIGLTKLGVKGAVKLKDQCGKYRGYVVPDIDENNPGFTKTKVDFQTWIFYPSSLTEPKKSTAEASSSDSKSRSSSSTTPSSAASQMKNAGDESIVQGDEWWEEQYSQWNYLPHGVANIAAYADFLSMNWAQFFMQHLLKLKLKARKRVPLVSENIAQRLPVIIFSHGLGGSTTSNAFLCEDFASKGYLVFAVGHADGTATLSCTSTGRLVPHQKLTFAQQTSDEALWELRNSQVEHRGYEIQFLIDVILNDLQEGKHCPLFKGRISCEDIYVCGHSYGGATAIHTSFENVDTIRACVALDPIMYPFREIQLKKARFVQPLAVIDSEEWSLFKKRPPVVRKFMGNASQEPFEMETSKSRVGVGKAMIIESCLRVWLTVKESGHYNFCDFPIFFNSILQKLGKVRNGHPLAQLVIVSDLTTNFLDQHCYTDIESIRSAMYAYTHQTGKSEHNINNKTYNEERTTLQSQKQTLEAMLKPTRMIKKKGRNVLRIDDTCIIDDDLSPFVDVMDF